MRWNGVSSDGAAAANVFPHQAMFILTVVSRVLHGREMLTSDIKFINCLLSSVCFRED